ncbi:hypothetical protein LAZ67_11003688 [Cordylochernes scorpioides]|uniref:Integrase catalytic domain-containing protein n=1 Tax=Cordylochernes scorpioides TaxID=51811 RepID=A0ABY6L0V5_9ARAC|nr:hypothetical protein LAZ67_11003688 [Cordylochernes scorpioides]
MDKLKKACETKKRTLESVIAEADGELGKQEPSLEMLMSLRPKLLRCKDRFLIASDCLIEQLIKADREDEEIEDVDIFPGGTKESQIFIDFRSWELPKFGGEAREWLQFWSAFQSVHDDDSISACVKFQYLQNCMIKGSVSEEIVSSFPNSAANYPLVISTLKERFGREDMLVEVSLRRVERTRHHHKPDEDGKHKSSEVLLEKLMEFLKHEVEGSERMRLLVNRFRVRIHHNLIEISRRRHLSPPLQVCKKHRAILCPVSKGSQKSDGIEERSKNINASVDMSNQIRCQDVLLQTIMVKIDGENKSKVVRAMLDSGSQNSYVLEQTASEVGLTMLGKKEVVHLLFGGVKSRPQQHKRYRIYISDVDSKWPINDLVYRVQRSSKLKVKVVHLNRLACYKGDKTDWTRSGRSCLRRATVLGSWLDQHDVPYKPVEFNQRESRIPSQLMTNSDSQLTTVECSLDYKATLLQVQNTMDIFNEMAYYRSSPLARNVAKELYKEKAIDLPGLPTDYTPHVACYTPTPRTRLDMAQAYEQLKVDETSAEILAINTPRGLYKVKPLPFGLNSAVGTFQRFMDTLLSRIDGVAVYLDDVLISGKDCVDLKRKTEKVLLRFRESGLCLKREKCKFDVPEIEFLGMIIDHKGIRPSEEKLRAINDARTPSDKMELMSFLALLNYYESNNPWKWNKEHQRSFAEAKDLISSKSVLAHFNEDLPILVNCDASEYGVGVILSQIDHGIERPVVFASLTLNKTERRYAVIDREALAVIFAVSKFSQYLLGRKFKIVTDHKPLVGLFNPNKPIPQVLSPRMMRWCLTLSAYTYTIEYKPGIKNGNVDTLSRLPLNESPSQITNPPEWIGAKIVASTSAENTINTMREMFATHGLPDMIVTDNGTSFTSEVFKTFLKRSGISHILCCPYHAASNGQVERAIQTLKKLLKKNSRGNWLIRRIGNYGQGIPWFQWLPGVVSEKTGPVSIKVETEDGKLLSRHLDQVRRSGESEALPSTSSTPQVTPEIERPPAVQETDSSEGTTKPVLRRSLRIRKPPSFFEN